MSPAALRALADAADALARLARSAADDSSNDPAALVPLAEAARVARTSLRVAKDAIRAGDLVSYGKQRDRSVRRADLDAWIESRRSKPTGGPDDRDIDRRMRALEGGRR